MTHELKTPLASVKLQGEVIHDAIERLDPEKLQDLEYVDKQKAKIDKLSHRLIQDGNKLELTMDKILQLSRIEGGGGLYLQEVDLKDLIDEVIHKHFENLEIEIQWNHQSDIYADEFALSLIIKNLLENTRNHSGDNKVSISTKESGDYVVLTYRDQGQFRGDLQKLGTLFYKFQSKKGSGIGLYLIKNLMEKMKGGCYIETTPSMTFTLSFKKGGQYV